jgi:hypothetical protein
MIGFLRKQNGETVHAHVDPRVHQSASQNVLLSLGILATDLVRSFDLS